MKDYSLARPIDTDLNPASGEWAEGAVFVTVYSHNRVDRYDPATGATTTLAEVPAPPMGLAFDAGGVLWMTSGTLYEGPGYADRARRGFREIERSYR